MEFTPFKLAIMAIATLAILYIFLTYLTPYFTIPADAQKQIQKALETAVMKPGKTIESENTVFNSEAMFSGTTFREEKMEVKFECNSVGICCDKGTKCPNTIEWNEASVLFKQKKTILTFARCDTQHNIAACTVFFGQKPAQLKIVSTNSKSTMDLAKENLYNIDLLLKNEGTVFAPGVFVKTSLYKYNQEKTTRELVLEKNSEETELNPGEEKLVPISLPLELAGNYVVEIHAEGENSGFDENTIEFLAIGTNASLCHATEKGEIQLNSITGKCEQDNYCSNCYYAFECKNAWQTAEPDKTFTEADPYHAIETTEPTNGSCQPETIPPTENPQENQFEACKITTEITKTNNPGILGKDCTDNIELLKKYAKQNGLETNGIDVLLLEAIIMDESNCDAQANLKGLMQVDDCQKDNCSTEENINRGTQALNNNLEAVKKQGFSGSNAIKLMLFGNNRGIASANKAIDFMMAGKQFQEAMLEACYYFYDKMAYGNCYAFSREKCCNSYGYGSRYAEKILDDYKTLCDAANGTTTDGTMPNIQPWHPQEPSDPSDVTVKPK